VCYRERSGELIILLAGGDKSSQRQDIEAALELARHL
jgi:putative component of toxin-antitoxin plasmid stabilization module